MTTGREKEAREFLVSLIGLSAKCGKLETPIQNGNWSPRVKDCRGLGTGIPGGGMMDLLLDNEARKTFWHESILTSEEFAKRIKEEDDE